MNLSSLLEKRWYIQGINAAPVFLAAGPFSGIYGCKETLGYAYTQFIMKAKNGYIDLYYSRDDLHHMADTFLKLQAKKKGYLSSLIKKSEEQKKPLLDRIEKILFNDPDSLQRLPDEELLKEYKQAISDFYSCFGASHLIEAVALTSDVKLKDGLLGALSGEKQEKQFTRYLNILTNPDRKTFFTDFSESLRGIKDGKVSISEHIKKFFWIKSTWFGFVKYTPDMVAQDIKSLTADVDQMKKEDPEKLSIQLQLPKKVRELFEISRTVAWWQDDRKIVMLKGCCLLDKYANEISSRLNISPALIVYLLGHEISSMKNFNKDLLEERQKGALYFFQNEEIKVVSGNEFALYEKKISHGDDNKVKEITGICASLGKAIGRVRICLTPDQIGKIADGEILVTTMTRPEFVPAMQKAVAIVTDEGGLTCHAAIISREMRKPCVIATKNATKVLKDGMLVEVNADHSAVRIL